MVPPPPGVEKEGYWLTWNRLGWGALLGVRAGFWVASSWYSFWEVPVLGESQVLGGKIQYRALRE